jgi:YHS domain-containing protein
MWRGGARPDGEIVVTGGGMTLVVDPVCDMEIEQDAAEATLEYLGEVFYFCSENCKEAFEEDPESYLEESFEARDPEQDE